MANAQRKSSAAVDEQISELAAQASPQLWDFFAAVRHIDAQTRGVPRVGHSRRPEDDPVRFCQDGWFEFAPSAVSDYLPATSLRPAEMHVCFMGLLGPNGPLPHAFTDYIRRRQHLHPRDKTLAAFLDLFNHRLISLFYRAWAVHQQTVSHDRTDDDRFAEYVGSLLGIGMSSFRGRDAMPDQVKLHFAGWLGSGVATASGLRQILTEFFRVPVAIREFVGQWIEIPESDRCRLGAEPGTGRIGQSLVVGSRVWECQQKFRVRIGPLQFNDFQRLLPGSGSVARLAATVRNVVGLEYDWDVQLVLKADEIPATRLGAGALLGYTTWLTSLQPEDDSDVLVFDAGRLPAVSI